MPKHRLAILVEKVDALLLRFLNDQLLVLVVEESILVGVQDADGLATDLMLHVKAIAAQHLLAATRPIRGTRLPTSTVVSMSTAALNRHAGENRSVCDFFPFSLMASEKPKTSHLE